MQPFAAICLVLAFTFSGCADSAPPVRPATKVALRKFLDAKFVVTSVPMEMDEDLYHVLAAFAAGRRSDEFVRRVDFTSTSEAELTFSDSGMHGGGGISLKRKSGRWIVAQKWHFM